MECELKGGVLRPEIVVGFCPKQQTAVCEEFCNFSPQNAPVSGEDFFVDQLLNFSNEDAVEEAEQEEGEDKDVVDESGFLVSVKEEPFEEELQQPPLNSKKASPFLSPPPETDRNRDDFGSGLSVPAEEADLEWLSHFVEESFSQFSTPFPTGFKPNSEKPKTKPKPKPEPGSHPPKPRSFTPPASLSKAPRSKRARTGGRVWSNPNPVHDPVQPKKRETGSVGPPRRCSHCGVQKTPQWRTGPLGAKTLCNACGVRFKSGRLLPEYRPACSPTFSSELHSNNHRKVLEMRKKKEMNSSLSHPVPSFG